MNFKSTLTRNLILAVLVAFTGSLSAQVFYSEDFAEGLPAGWTSEDISDDFNAIWEYCESVNPLGANCSGTFGQGTFMSATPDNGFMTVNSDAAATANHGSNPHISVLTTTPIDCSMEPAVFIGFAAQIGTFELDASTSAILRVSNNGGTDWVEYTCFPGVGTVFSSNPYGVAIDISDTAGGESAVILQWQWTAGWEYFLNIDDVILSGEDPTPPHDMRVNQNFYAHAPNAQTPISQIETFGFLADIENIGANTQTNVVLRVDIEADANPGNIIFTDSLEYGSIAPDSLAENQLFASAGFTPPDEIAAYTGTYTIEADSADADLTNNSLMFDFEITENTFAKERGVTRVLGSAPGNWEDEENLSWAYGCSYFVVNGEDMFANHAVFGVANTANSPAPEDGTVRLALYKWEDSATEGTIGVCDGLERTIVGFANYNVTGDEPSAVAESSLITVDLIDNTSLLPGVPLEDNTNYILMLEYFAPDDQTAISYLGSGEYDYGAQTLRTEALGIEESRYGVFMLIADPTDQDNYGDLAFNPGGFSGGFNTPVARLIVDEERIVSSIITLSEDNIINVFPSPARNHINVDLELTELQDKVTLSLVNITGTRLGYHTLENVQKDSYRFDVSNMPAGSYFLNVSTAKGSRNIPVVIAK